MHYNSESICILNGELEADNLVCEVCWLDRYAPAEIEIPGVGKFKIPESAQGQKSSLTLLDVILYPV